MANRTAAQRNFDAVVEEIKENPFQDQTTLLAEFLDAALELWNEDIAGEIELVDGQCVTIQPVIPGY